MAALSSSLPSGKTGDQKDPPEIISGSLFDLSSTRSDIEGRNGPEIQEAWVHSALTPNPLGHWENSGTLFPTALQLCGCSLGAGSASLQPPVPLRADPPGQGCPWNPPLGAALLPAMDFPAQIKRESHGRNFFTLQEETAAVLDHQNVPFL